MSAVNRCLTIKDARRAEFSRSPTVTRLRNGTHFPHIAYFFISNKQTNKQQQQRPLALPPFVLYFSRLRSFRDQTETPTQRERGREEESRLQFGVKKDKTLLWIFSRIFSFPFPSAWFPRLCGLLSGYVFYDFDDRQTVRLVEIWSAAREHAGFRKR
ncbi:hypothetical protein AMELA_G00273080 [Ameiurus melas]|uniref:Uncharacterized protein n=1 Tax=Ameiurus melas TaxID=219545 RepID=A0A7J5ZL72_AMEME|nr:hypothetical protein AMELA_G00273080 [Ameiurus melas]